MRKVLLMGMFLFFFISENLLVYAHPGNTDSYGGHNKTSNGTYHCHSGQCMEDAKKEAADLCFPKGEQDGFVGKKDDEFLSDVLGKLDVDQLYFYDYCSSAYDQGYESTNVPTFWERYGIYVAIGGILVGALLLYLLSKVPKTIYKAIFHGIWAYISGVGIVLIGFGVIFVFIWGAGDLVMRGLDKLHVDKEKADSITTFTFIGIFVLILFVISKITGKFYKEKDNNQDIK